MQIFRRNGRREYGSNPPNWHFCMADGSAGAASAADGSRVSAAAFCAICAWRM
ncbi:MAG: hypothetical protein H0X30_10925 [Anaerolineae bacterium]|nr:hypothetical protein [Anaerolineae bacterium]